jgi:deoxyribodipyrimidine photo-lyase
MGPDMTMSTRSTFVPTRAAGIARMQKAAELIRGYAARRNYAEDSTSKLSPYLRRGLVLESELLDYVRSCGSFEQVEKFIQEIVWRTYWKGWLETRPQVWSGYLGRLAHLDETLSNALRSDITCALEGRTHLPFFNAWVRELAETGYLHNHIRMWFASVWIFTLKLPWELGARFFLEHLLDGDPASNTLSWRWVAGLHTAGKHYLARAENIIKYTEGRWAPLPGELDEAAPPIPDDGLARPPSRTLAIGPNERDVSPRAVLLHDEDCGPLDACWRGLPAIRLSTPRWHRHSPAALVNEFIAGACADADLRHGNVLSVHDADSALNWCKENGISEIWAIRPLTGFTATALNDTGQKFLAGGVSLRYADRQHNLTFLPLANRGFFPFWSSAASILRCGWN